MAQAILSEDFGLSGLSGAHGGGPAGRGALHDLVSVVVRPSERSCCEHVLLPIVACKIVEAYDVKITCVFAVNFALAATGGVYSGGRSPLSSPFRGYQSG